MFETLLSIELLQTMASVSDISHEDLMKRQVGAQLSFMSKECASWSATSHRLAVFSALVLESGSVIGYFPDLTIDLFMTVLSTSTGDGSAKNIDYELQLKLFIVLSKQLCHVDSTLNSQSQFDNYSTKVLTSKNIRTYVTSLRIVITPHALQISSCPR